MVNWRSAVYLQPIWRSVQSYLLDAQDFELIVQRHWTHIHLYVDASKEVIDE